MTPTRNFIHPGRVSEHTPRHFSSCIRIKNTYAEIGNEHVRIKGTSPTSLSALSLKPGSSPILKDSKLVQASCCMVMLGNSNAGNAVLLLMLRKVIEKVCASDCMGRNDVKADYMIHAIS